MFFIDQDYIWLNLQQQFDVGPPVLRYWYLDKKLQKQQKNVENYENWKFYLICWCLHGNSKRADKTLSIVLVTMAYCLYYVNVNHTWRFPEGSGRQGSVERYCCNVICGASEVKGLRWDEMKPHKISNFKCLENLRPKRPLIDPGPLSSHE